MWVKYVTKKTIYFQWLLDDLPWAVRRAVMEAPGDPGDKEAGNSSRHKVTPVTGLVDTVL